MLHLSSSAFILFICGRFVPASSRNLLLSAHMSTAAPVRFQAADQSLPLRVFDGANIRMAS